MSKKYLETKNNSLESSVLGVWQTAIEEGDARMDGRTKGYKSHRSKLEAARLRREEKKVNKEEVELDEHKGDKPHKHPHPPVDEASGDKEAYQKFFNAALKKFGVKSPAELKGDQKKKFYDYIDKGWEGDNEKAEAAMSQVREFKIQSMKAALAQVWGMEEGKNPFAEHKGTKPHKHPHEEDKDEEHGKKTKTETGKKPAVIDLKPEIADR